MADGTVVKTEFSLYSSATGTEDKFLPGYSQYEQTNDSGNPVALEEKPPHRLDSGYRGSE